MQEIGLVFLIGGFIELAAAVTCSEVGSSVDLGPLARNRHRHFLVGGAQPCPLGIDPRVAVIGVDERLRTDRHVLPTGDIVRSNPSTEHTRSLARLAADTLNDR